MSAFANILVFVVNPQNMLLLQ